MIVRAEWPGLVLEYLVKPGQEVEEGEPLILMEGSDAERTAFYVHAPEQGKIGRFLVEEGEYVYEDDEVLDLKEAEGD